VAARKKGGVPASWSAKAASTRRRSQGHKSVTFEMLASAQLQSRAGAGAVGAARAGRAHIRAARPAPRRAVLGAGAARAEASDAPRVQRPDVAAHALAAAEAPRAAAGGGGGGAAAAAPLGAPGATLSPYAVEYDAALAAVKLASRLCQAVQVQLTAGEWAEKEDGSPVSVADLGAQALVAWSLHDSFAGAPFSMVAEEDAADLRVESGAATLARVTELVNEALAGHGPPGAPALSPEQVCDLIDTGASPGGAVGRHWVLDPIDGTRGFVGGRQYAVCLGLLDAGELVLGVLGAPNLPEAAITDADCASGQASVPGNEHGVGCAFAAELGRGAWAGPLWVAAPPARRVACDDALAPAACRFMESFEKRHSNHSISAAVAARIGVVLPSLKLDSQAKYGALSRGDASIFMRFPDLAYREKIWDHVGAVVVTEAGGRITDALGNKLDFSQGRFFPFLNGGLVAATPSMHAAIMGALQEIRDAEKENFEI
jgi:3'(2'), 5'-bisphosphate nucleotidase/inositol polyphosphate 1-phosphatase